MENASIVLTPPQQQEVEALLADVKPHADIITDPNADVASAEFQGANDQLFRVLIKCKWLCCCRFSVLCLPLTPRAGRQWIARASTTR